MAITDDKGAAIPNVNVVPATTDSPQIAVAITDITGHEAVRRRHFDLIHCVRKT
jgi:hypothetical protein